MCCVFHPLLKAHVHFSADLRDVNFNQAMLRIHLTRKIISFRLAKNTYNETTTIRKAFILRFLNVVPRKQLLLYLLFLGIALLVTFPAILNLSSQVMGGTTGDNFEMLRNIWWFKFALQTGQPLYYQSYFAYPEGFSGIILAANQLQFLPAYLFAFVMPLTLAYNLTIWLTMALNGWAMYWLARDLLGENNEVPAIVAGIVFMTAPTFQGHLFEGHAGLMVQWAMPLLIWGLWRLVHAENKIKRLTLFSIIMFNLTPSGHMLQVFYALMPIIGVFLLGLVYRKDWRGIRRVLTVCVLASAFMLVFLLPMIQETLQTSSYTEAGGVVRYSADLLSLVSPSFFHPMWSWLPYTRDVLGVNLGEGSAYLGVFGIVLIALAVWKQRESRWWLLLGAMAWVLSLGSLLKVLNQPLQIDLGDYQTYVPMPWALVQDVTGFSLARTPGRFNFVIALAVAMLVGYGISVLWQWGITRKLQRQIQYGAVVLLVLGMLWDTQFFFPLPTRSTDIPQAVYDLANRDDVRAIFSVPWNNLLAAKDTLLLQTAHQRPLIAGQITRETPVNPAKLNILQNTMSPSLLRLEGADVVIFHKDRAREMGDVLFNRLNAQLSSWGTLIYEDEQIAIYNVPQPLGEPAPYLLTEDGGEFNTRYVTDFYMPSVGWVDFSAVVGADNRDVTLWVNNIPLHRWAVQGEIPIRVPIPIVSAGYYRVEMRLDDPCPNNYPTVLTCRGLSIRNSDLDFSDVNINRPIVPFERGVTLQAVTATNVNNQLQVRLWWQFDEPMSNERDVRFVHVLNERGEVVLQNDSTLGTIPANEEWAETVIFSLQSLPEGTYTVRTGWYTFPDIVRFRVLDETAPGAQDRAIDIAEIEIP
jgi:hypothetical protein